MAQQRGSEEIEEVRRRADIVEIIGAHLRLRRVGRNFVGLCPFHNEKTPSFSVSPERGFFHCFGCGAGGTVFDFVMRLEGLTFAEALNSLASRYGVTLRGSGRGDSEKQPAGEREICARANELASEFFAHVLWKTGEGNPARSYLRDRAISEETARAFKLGVAPAGAGSLARALERRGLLEAGLRVGLLRKDPARGLSTIFTSRLIFPIRDPRGRVLGFGGRALEDREGKPKYINSPESPVYSKARTLYGLFESHQAIMRSSRAVIVEGYFDAITAWQAGFKEVVASCGTALTGDQLRLLGRYSDTVIACFDSDEAGRSASLRALEVFLGAGLLGRAIFLPAGFDPDSLIRKRGGQAFGELAAGAELLVDYFLRELTRGGTLPMEQRVKAAKRVAEVLRAARDEVQFNLLVRKAADLLGLREEVLRQQARPSRARTAQPAASAASGTNLRSRAVEKAEIGLLAIALLYPALRPDIVASAPQASFTDQTLANLLGELCASEDPRSLAESWLHERLSPEHRAALSALALGPFLDEEQKAQTLVQDYVRWLEKRRGEREVEALRMAVVNNKDKRGAQGIIDLRRGLAADARRET